MTKPDRHQIEFPAEGMTFANLITCSHGSSESKDLTVVTTVKPVLGSFATSVRYEVEDHGVTVFETASLAEAIERYNGI